VEGEEEKGGEEEEDGDQGPVVEKAHGYSLFLSDKNATGYMGVRKEARSPPSYVAKAGGTRHRVIIGSFKTVVEAAVAYAKHRASLGSSSDAAPAASTSASPRAPAPASTTHTSPAAPVKKEPLSGSAAFLQHQPTLASLPPPLLMLPPPFQPAPPTPQMPQPLLAVTRRAMAAGTPSSAF